MGDGSLWLEGDVKGVTYSDGFVLLEHHPTVISNVMSLERESHTICTVEILPSGSILLTDPIDSQDGSDIVCVTAFGVAEKVGGSTAAGYCDDNSAEDRNEGTGERLRNATGCDSATQRIDSHLPRTNHGGTNGPFVNSLGQSGMSVRRGLFLMAGNYDKGNHKPHGTNCDEEEADPVMGPESAKRVSRGSGTIAFPFLQEVAARFILVVVVHDFRHIGGLFR